ncbi:phosphatase PAP2 family protein [Acinetobacter bereziniae]|uniref:phosphatase PAP2 family protein n=1 Tax=Acinetobacter bereziniae TaxID=106648 RepID=UPI00295361CF|nr:phosphatase PAP2 family protein [Acinetobacter bereziniae]MDV8157369.1 phosphatase PAP2 family protein [Acinetobacter bereziniae]
MMILFFIVPIFCVLAWELIHHYYAINTPLFLMINGMPPHSDWFWQNITFMGDGLTAYVLLIFFCRHNAHLLWLGLLAVLITGFGVQGIKQSIDVLRPIGYLGIEHVQVIGKILKHDSFPSGHAATAFVLAGVLSKYIKLNSFRYHRAFTFCVISLATLIALSRVVVGVHWPLDIVIGALWGWYSATIILKLSSKTKQIGRTRFSANILYALAAISAGFLWRFDGGYPLALGLAKLLSVCALTYITLILIELNFRVKLVFDHSYRPRLRSTSIQLQTVAFEKNKS